MTSYDSKLLSFMSKAPVMERKPHQGQAFNESLKKRQKQKRKKVEKEGNYLDRPFLSRSTHVNGQSVL